MTRPVHKNGSRGVKNKRYCGCGGAVSETADEMSSSSVSQRGRTHWKTKSWITCGLSCRLGSASKNTPRSSNADV